MFKRLLVLVVALFCFCGVGLAEKVSGDVSTDIFVKVVGVDEFFRDGVNGVRWGATVDECEDRVKSPVLSPYVEDVYIYRRTDGLNFMGRFLNSTDWPDRTEERLFFEGKDYVNKAVMISYHEIAYGVDGDGVVKWAKEVWGEPDYCDEFLHELFYRWSGEEKKLWLLVKWDGSSPSGSIKDAVVTLVVEPIVDDGSVGVDEYFKDGVNGIRFGASVAECGERVSYSSSSKYREGFHVYRRTDGLNVLGKFLGDTKRPDRYEARFFFEGDDLDRAVMVRYQEIVYGVNRKEVVKRAKEVFGKTDYYEHSLYGPFYCWYDKEKDLTLLVEWDMSSRLAFMENARVTLEVGKLDDDPVGLDEFFRDGVNGIRWGATLEECGDRVRFSRPSSYGGSVYNYYDRVDGLNFLGRFLNHTEQPYECRTGFAFKRDDKDKSVMTTYNEVVYGVDSEDVLRWARQMWGRPTNQGYKYLSGGILYSWKGVTLVVRVGEPPFDSLENAVISLNVSR